MKIKTAQGQNMVDIALERYGSLEGLVKLCLDNRLHIGEDIVEDRMLSIDEDFTADEKVATYIKKQKISIHTGI